MPELPEVETIVRALAPRLVGRKILGARFLSKVVLRGGSQRIQAGISRKTIRSVRRHGKHILVELVPESYLGIHLGMTGRLLLGASPGPYTRAVFTLDDGLLCYDDVRQFGRIEWMETLPDRITRLGPDPLAIPAQEFCRLLHARRGKIKALLLNQSFVRGLGNIYSDEALFRARIHPLAACARISVRRAKRLHEAIVEVLNEAIEKGGSSVSDYVDADGRKGWFQLRHLVYRKTGQPCSLCSTPIRRIVVTQRSTHYCPRCQRV